MTARRLTTAAVLLGAIVLAACGVRHEHIEQDFAMPLDAAASGALRVNVFMMSGGVRLSGAPAGGLYEGSLEYCRDHMSGTAQFTPAGEASPSRLDVSVQGLPGVFLGFGGERNSLDLGLSRQVPLQLEVRLGSRESILDLSGMRLEALDLEGGAGDMRLIFAEPNPDSARRLSIDAMMGDVSIDRLGNANSVLTTVRGGLGSVEVDLSGEWLVEGRLVIEASVGDVVLKLPEGLAARLRIGEPWDEDLAVPGYELRDGILLPADLEGTPRVDVEVEAGIGNLTVETQ